MCNAEQDDTHGNYFSNPLVDHYSGPKQTAEPTDSGPADAKPVTCARRACPMRFDELGRCEGAVGA